MAEAEAALGHVELRAGHAEVEQRGVDGPEAGAVEGLLEVGERGVVQLHPRLQIA